MASCVGTGSCSLRLTSRQRAGALPATMHVGYFLAIVRCIALATALERSRSAYFVRMALNSIGRR